jgi:hypothetical protein
MPREAALFEQAGGSPVRGYLLMKEGGGNVPPMWIERAEMSRKERQSKVATAIRKGGAVGILSLEDWELAYRKECFYRGIRILMDLEEQAVTCVEFHPRRTYAHSP